MILIASDTTQLHVTDQESVTSSFKPDPETHSSSSSQDCGEGCIAGGVAGAVVGFLVLLALFYCCCCDEDNKVTPEWGLIRLN